MPSQNTCTTPWITFMQGAHRRLGSGLSVGPVVRIGCQRLKNDLLAPTAGIRLRSARLPFRAVYGSLAENEPGRSFGHQASSPGVAESSAEASAADTSNDGMEV